MNIKQIKLVNDERLKALERLKPMHDAEIEFNKCYRDKLKTATEGFIKDFINYFSENGWTVDDKTYGHRIITFKYGMECYQLDDINYKGNAITLTTGNNYNPNMFYIEQKKSDPNYLSELDFNVEGIYLQQKYEDMHNYDYGTDYEQFLKKFVTVEKVKQLEDEIEKYVLLIQKCNDNLDKVRFYISTTHIKGPDEPETNYYDSAESLIESL